MFTALLGMTPILTGPLLNTRYFERFGIILTAMMNSKAWYEKASGMTQFINSKKLIDWNVDKHYFKDLTAKGINIPKTLFVESGEKINLLQALDKAKRLGFTSDTYVLKPCIAGGAWHTYKFHESQWKQYDAIFCKLIENEALMLQEFQKNIVDEGEVSIMVFGGQFTHAILKKAKKGDFRVQSDYGGSVENYQPTQEEISFAIKVCKACKELPDYGRVDIFKDNDGKIALAELEIFEPELWFRFYPDAVTIMTKNIKETYFT